MRSRVYRDSAVEAADVDLEAVAKAIADGRIAWVHATPDELPAVAAALRLNHHAVEDALKGVDAAEVITQRAKLERYPGHAFLYLYLARVDGGREQLEISGAPVFVSRSYIVTLDTPSGISADDLTQRWDTHPDLMGHGTPAHLHAVLDLVVDSHLQAVDDIGDLVDQMEDLLFEGPVQDVQVHQRQAYATRKSLVRMRRVATPMRELVSGVMRREEEDETPIDVVLMPYYQDLYDHVLRVNDTLEGLRDLVSSLYETRIAMADHTLNTVMKKLAAWAAIIAVPTAVTGFYGQNLEYPLVGTGVGFVVSTAIWAGGGAALWWTFRSRHWL